MLAQPVFSSDLSSERRRWLAVLVDDSPSMRIADSGLSASEKLRLAEALGIDGMRRPYAMDKAADDLDAARMAVVPHAEFLAALGEAKLDTRQRQMEARRKKMSQDVAAAVKAVARQKQLVEAAMAGKLKLDARISGVLKDATACLSAKLAESLGEAARLTQEEAAGMLAQQHERLLKSLRQSAADLSDTAQKLRSVAGAIDELTLASLGDAQKKKVDELTRITRLELAQRLLTAGPPGPDGKAAASPLQKLAAAYAVKAYRFEDGPTEIDPAELARGKLVAVEASSRPATAPAAADDCQYTDYAAALQRVLKDMSGRECAGVVLVGEGRHNGPGALEAAARQLGLQGMPIYSLAMGAVRPPLDAAIAAVEAPETVYLKDRLFVDATVKLDGLAGKDVRVSLMDGTQEVDSKTLRATGDAFRTKVQLADTPAQLGSHAYSVKVQAVDGEVFASNNSYPIGVTVTDERMRLLMVDGRPRWEFRYLKNLFADRDKTVSLQYVLLEPDQIAEAPRRPAVAASVSRPPGEVEATLLPKDEAEWLKFDTIILGDVNPAMLPPAQVDTLRKFVTERGGTLIVIAGRNYMPHAYASTAMSELLPVKFAASDKAVLTGPEPAYRIALTAEGASSVIMRQEVDPSQNAAVWASVPDIFWRHPIEEAKPGATVLAYALPQDAPDYARPTTAPASQPAQEADAARQKRLYEQKNALIASHNPGLGKVMFLSFDHTWRLRYRVGDTYHHKFWGQVLRWATEGKLPIGTDQVRLGADHTRYSPHQSINVQAKLVERDFRPVISDDVYVRIMQGSQQIARRKLTYVPGSAGLYRGEIGELPTGAYRLELDSSQARALLPADKQGTIAMDFSVDPSTPLEQVELSADPATLKRIAELAGGAVLSAADAASLPDRIGPGTVRTAEFRQTTLWDSWPLLAVLVAAMTIEWIVRKKVGLA
jgi:hypothetical protein